MPLHSALRRQIPSTATDVVVTTIKRAFGERAPVILDYQDEMGDEFFYDVSHLNGGGRTAFTAILARGILQHLPRRETSIH